MPEPLRGQYQYFTQADISKLRRAGYSLPFTSLEDAIRDYVRTYLAKRQSGS
jgi:ADP-L-glycero-D-manno-heptose 6-epimerase